VWETRRTTGRRSIAIALLATLVIGCVPGREVVSTPATVVLVGRLDGEQTQARECLWLVDDAETKIDLLLPTGWRAQFDPVIVIDSTGTSVARAGDRIRVTGPKVVGETLCSTQPPFEVVTLEHVP
jgi:hypothetical protein